MTNSAKPRATGLRVKAVPAIFLSSLTLSAAFFTLAALILTIYGWG
jgi:hypothetical protein